MTKSDIIQALEEKFSYHEKICRESVDIILKTIQNALIEGRNIELRYLATFKIRTARPRMSRNPRTGEKLETDYVRKIRFKPCTVLFRFLNKDLNVAPAIEPRTLRKIIKEKLKECKGRLRAIV